MGKKYILHLKAFLNIDLKIYAPISPSIMCSPSPAPTPLSFVAQSLSSLIASTCSVKKWVSKKSHRCGSSLAEKKLNFHKWFRFSKRAKTLKKLGYDLWMFTHVKADFSTQELITYLFKVPTQGQAFWYIRLESQNLTNWVLKNQRNA